MKTFIEVVGRSATKTSNNVLNSAGQPASYVTLTLAKDSLRVENHPLTGKPMVVRGLPTTITENQWLEACKTNSGTDLRRGLIADAQVGEHVEGDILRLGAADGIDPYTGSLNSAYKDNTYTITNILFLGEFDQDSPEFEARVQKAVDRFNAQMVAAGRVGVLVP